MLVIEIITWFYNPGAEFYIFYINLIKGYNKREDILLFYITVEARRVFLPSQSNSYWATGFHHGLLNF